MLNETTTPETKTCSHYSDEEYDQHGEYIEIMHAMGAKRILCVIGAFNGKRPSWMVCADATSPTFPTDALLQVLSDESMKQLESDSLVLRETPPHNLVAGGHPCRLTLADGYTLLEGEEAVDLYLHNQDALLAQVGRS